MQFRFKGSLFKFTVSLNKHLSSYFEQYSLHKTEMHQVKENHLYFFAQPFKGALNCI